MSNHMEPLPPVEFAQTHEAGAQRRPDEKRPAVSGPFSDRVWDYFGSLNVMKLARPSRSTRIDTERLFGKALTT